MSFLSATFTPVNTTIFFITLISFIISLILFFEFVLADYPEKIILDKTSIIAMYAKENNGFNTMISKQLKDIDNSEIAKLAELDKEARTTNNNKALMDKGVLPFLLVIIAMFIVYVVYLLIIKYKYKRNLNFEKSDIILIILAIMCFMVEIVFYFIIVHNWKFIPDNEVIRILLS